MSLDPGPPPAPDQVSALIVQASSKDHVPGPAWWKVTKGEATLWIMATPDRMPSTIRFDDGPLRQRIAAARLVIAPTSPTYIGAPTPRETLLYKEPASNLKIPATPLAQRIPASLMARVNARVADNPVRDKAERNWLVNDTAPVSTLRPGDAIARQLFPLHAFGDLAIQRIAPLQYSSTMEVAFRLSRPLSVPGSTGNPAADLAADLGGKGGKPVRRLNNTAADLIRLHYFYQPDEATQEACLTRVLDALDAGVRLEDRLAAFDAWAIGDVAHAAKRYNVFSTCDMGPTGRAYWAGLVKNYVDAATSALSSPGQAVMIAEFDALQIRGGVLDQLAAQGYDIQAPAQ